MKHIQICNDPSHPTSRLTDMATKASRARRSCGPAVVWGQNSIHHKSDSGAGEKDFESNVS